MRSGLEQDGIHTVAMESAGGRSLPASLAPGLHEALLRLSQLAPADAAATRALRALVGFTAGLKGKYSDIELVQGPAPEPGLADNGDLEHDLQALLETAGDAARAAGSAVVLFVNQMHELCDEDLGALVGALHRCAQQRLPVILVGAGLPSLPGRMGQVRSYSERLFQFHDLGRTGS